MTTLFDEDDVFLDRLSVFVRSCSDLTVKLKPLVQSSDSCHAETREFLNNVINHASRAQAAALDSLEDLAAFTMILQHILVQLTDLVDRVVTDRETDESRLLFDYGCSVSQSLDAVDGVFRLRGISMQQFPLKTALYDVQQLIADDKIMFVGNAAFTRFYRSYAKDLERFEVSLFVSFKGEEIAFMRETAVLMRKWLVALMETILSKEQKRACQNLVSAIDRLCESCEKLEA